MSGMSYRHCQHLALAAVAFALTTRPARGSRVALCGSSEAVCLAAFILWHLVSVILYGIRSGSPRTGRCRGGWLPRAACSPSLQKYLSDFWKTRNGGDLLKLVEETA